MKKILTLCLLTYLFSNQFLYAQDGCDQVLALAGNNVSIDQKTASVLKNILEEFKSAGSAESSRSWSAKGYDLASGVGIKLGSGSKSSQWKELEKIYNSQYSSYEYSNSYSKTAVTEAIAAWEQCKNLDKIKFEVVITPSQVIVSIQNASSTDVTFQGVAFTSTDVKIRAAVGKRDEKIIISKDVAYKHKLDEAKKLNIFIERIPQKEESDIAQIVYPKTDVIIATDYGNLKLILPSDGKPTLRYLSDIEQRFSEMQSEINVLKETNPKKIDGKNCIRTGETQICWGSFNLPLPTLSRSGASYSSFDIKFDEPFVGKPSITNSVDTYTASSQGPSYTVYSHTLTDSTYTGAVTIATSSHRKDSKIKIDYVAIGKWK